MQLRGTQKYAVRIELDPVAMNACDIAMEDMAKAVGDQNVNQPPGSLIGPNRAMTLMANGQLSEAGKYGAVILVVCNGKPVRLADVAKVIDGAENTRDRVLVPGYLVRWHQRDLKGCARVL